MKKNLLSLFTMLFIANITLGQVMLYVDNFDSYIIGEKLSFKNPVNWTTWSNQPGSPEDPLISGDYSVSVPNSVKISGTNDALMLLGDKTTGKYNVMFRMYIPSGNNLGYFNVLQDFAGSNSTWGLQVYFNLGGIGVVDGNGEGAATFTFSYNTWLDVKVFVDLDTDWCQFFLNNSLIHEYQWSNGTTGSGILKLDGLNFYAWNSGGNPLYYLDDIVYERDVIIDQNIEIPQGWSGISSNLDPTDPDVEQMLSAIEEQLIILRDYQGNIFQAPDENTIPNWDYTKGYYIKMSSLSTLDIIGIAPMSRQIDMQSGWNLIPVLSKDPVSIEDYFGGKITKVEIVTEVAGVSVYWPEQAIKTLTLLVPGKAYLVKTTESFELFEVPDVTSSQVGSVTSASAIAESNVADQGGSPVISRGFVWSTDQNPTLIKNQGYTSNGSGTGIFTGYFSGLSPAKTYFLRAYASNTHGTAFGEQLVFTTPDTPAGPQLTLDKTNMEIVLRDQGEVSNQTIFVRNTGSQPLQFNLEFQSSKAGHSSKINQTQYFQEVLPENSESGDQHHQPECAPGVIGGREAIVSDALFNKQFEFSVGASNSQAGIETDGNFFYVTKWNGAEFFRYSLSGDYLGSFTIPGVSGIRDLAYDGIYFYGSAANTNVYKMDFNSKTLISTISAPTAVRAIAYDYDSNGFWANNWATPLTLFNSNGVTLKTITLSGDESFYGLAWDPQGPSLWGYSQRDGTSQNLLYKYALPAGSLLLQFDVMPLLTMAFQGDIAGGLAFFENLISGTYSIIGLAQGKCIWGLEAGTISIPWVTATPVAGDLSPGQTIPIQVTLISTIEECGEQNETFIFTSNDLKSPNTFQVTLTSAYEGCLPAVTTQELAEIDFYSATVIGSVISDGGIPVYQRGFVWGRMGNPTVENNHGFSNDGYGIGEFSTEMADLIPFEAYHVRAYAINESGIVYGVQLNFMPAVLAPSIPTVVTYGANDITAFTATAGGYVAFDGYDEVTSRGLVWSTSYDPTLENYEGIAPGDEGGLGMFTSYLDGLSPATTYYMRAYATNVIGTAYGQNVQFTTLSVYPPSVYTEQATEITINSAVSGGIVWDDGNDPYTVRGIVWSTSEDPTIEVNLGNLLNDGLGEGSYVSYLTGLTPATTYYVRAYAINIAGIEYGQEISFTILEIIPATVTTAQVTNITSNSAISGGIVLDDGNDPYTVRGIVWSTSEEPTIEVNLGNILDDGLGEGSYLSILTGLVPATTYYVRAYAINVAGIEYGQEVTFTTLEIIPATVTTAQVTNITSNSAFSGGNVLDDGNDPVTMRGVVWDTSTDPTIENNEGITSDGNGEGPFSSILTNLNQSTTYYVRAYAINSTGTSYGENVSFVTGSSDGSCPDMPTITDIDGNVYNTVLIGNQCWMKENLMVTTYKNGVSIPNISGNNSWANTTIGAYAWYDNQISWKTKYGALYNWHAVASISGLCPTGWHIPSDDEWSELINYAGGANSPNGNKLKSCRQMYSPLGGECNTEEHPRWGAMGGIWGTNDFGFSALPGGFRYDYGPSSDLGVNGAWWTSEELSFSAARGYNLSIYIGGVNTINYDKRYGFSVRCLRD